MLNRPHAVRPCNPRICSLQAFPILTPTGHSKHSLDLPIGLCATCALERSFRRDPFWKGEHETKIRGHHEV
jgi:hypothetical protein